MEPLEPKEIPFIPSVENGCVIQPGIKPNIFQRIYYWFVEKKYIYKSVYFIMQDKSSIERRYLRSPVNTVDVEWTTDCDKSTRFTFMAGLIMCLFIRRNKKIKCSLISCGDAYFLRDVFSPIGNGILTVDIDHG